MIRPARFVEAPFAAILAVTLSACTGGGPPVCETPLDPPEGFAQIETFEEEFDGHIGVRLSYLDDQDRLLHTAAGIPGEWGETASLEGEIPLSSGGAARLLAGVEGVWFAIWEEQDQCDPRVVIGNEFERSEFLAVLEDAGIASPRSS